MVFEKGDIYHIYNQGNNRIPIFFSKENYLFFLKKIQQHVLPHADILAWCLMPNHFHLMIYVHTPEIKVSEQVDENGRKTIVRTSGVSPKTCNLNKSIGILLASYTRAVNNLENRTGSLFRGHTHAECLTNPGLTTPSFFITRYGTVINRHLPEEEYPQVCFNYIHFNPVKARLVKNAQDWEYSSYPDYDGARNGKLVNKSRAEELGLEI